MSLPPYPQELPAPTYSSPPPLPFSLPSHQSTPPPPPPKPSSRLSTPHNGPPLPPPPAHAPYDASQQQMRYPQPADGFGTAGIPPPGIDDGWLPEGVKDKS
ncbi:hypothetical protein MMC32_007237, partial [Xylographa parallela]|nr:hypothetical protein [Xylographa parallela]